jgi:hypothetical protein
VVTGLRFFSYGGGVQSTAALVLAAQGRIDYPTFVMANVGDDSERKTTLRYVRTWAQPFAANNGIELQILNRIKRDGSVETLLGRMTKEGSRSVPVPYRTHEGGPPMSRSCTADFKVAVTGKFAKSRGASKDNLATIALGITLDEIERVGGRKPEPHENLVYPLLSIGDETGLRLDRADCERIIKRAGLPVPPKSACWFCPMHRPDRWDDMARDEPEEFEAACDLEEKLTARQVANGKDPVYFTRFGRPLREIVRTDQPLLPLILDDAECDSGWCFT